MSLSPIDALKRRAREKQTELSRCEDPARRFELLKERNALLRQAKSMASTPPSVERMARASHGVMPRQKRRPRDPGLQLAIERCGDVKALARRLGLPPRTVASWRRAPAEHVARIAAEAGLDRGLLRPDLYGGGPAAEGELAGEP